MKDILVHLDSGPAREGRLNAAVDLAKRFDARLSGIFAQIDAHPGHDRPASDAFTGAAHQAKAAFTAAAAKAGVTARWLGLDQGSYEQVVTQTVHRARLSDLVVLTQHSPNMPEVPEELVEQVVFNSGRPALIFPWAGEYRTFGNHPAVAWNAHGSREEARALHDALPLLKTAGSVTLMVVSDKSRNGDAEPPTEVADHLAAHGIKARVEHLYGGDIGVMDLLLSRSFDLGCDLLVMGGHSATGISFTSGSGTRFMLRHQTLPLLMAG